MAIAVNAVPCLGALIIATITSFSARGHMDTTHLVKNVLEAATKLVILVVTMSLLVLLLTVGCPILLFSQEHRGQ